jgi:hypothetical protein
LPDDDRSPDGIDQARRIDRAEWIKIAAKVG